MANLLGYVGRRSAPYVVRRFIGANNYRYYSASQNLKSNLSEPVGEDPIEPTEQASKGNINEVQDGLSKAEMNAEESVPWYLRDDSSSPLLENKNVELPFVPDHAPSSVNTFLELLSNEYGLEDIELFDLTQ